MHEQLRIEWEITTACPLSCPDCSCRQLPHAADLAFSRQLEVADRLAAAGVGLVSLSGGEPLAHPHWESLARRLVVGGVSVQLLTSACLWDATTARRVREAGIGRVWLGVDAVGGAHDQFRGQRGLWDKVTSAVDDLRAEGVDFGVFTTVRPGTVTGLESLARWARDAGVTDWFLWRAVSGDRTGAGSGDRGSPGFPRSAIERTIARTLKETRVWFGDTWRPDEVQCGAGETVLGITADGKVRGCLLQLDEPEVGDVLETDLSQLAARARGLRHTRGCTACAAQAKGTSPSMRKGAMRDIAAMVPLAAIGTIAALSLGAGGCRSTETGSTPPAARTQAQQTQPPAEPEAKIRAEADGKVPPPVTLTPMRPGPNCCYSRALIRDCKCDWNRPVNPPAPPTPTNP